MPHTPRTLYYVGSNGTTVSYINPNVWSTSRGGAAGNGVGTPDVADTGYPDAGDTVRIEGYTPQFSGSDQSAVSLAAIYVDASTTTIPPFPPLSMGTSGAPLKLTIANNGSASFKGPYGDLYLGITMGGSGTMVEFAGNANVFMSGISASGAGTLIAAAGVLNIASDYGGSYNLRGTGGSINVAATALSGTPTATMDTGRLSSGRTLGATILDGDGASGELWGTAAISSITLKSGTNYRHNSVGTVTFIEVRSQAKARSGNLPFTTTNATVFGDGSLFTNSGLVTYSNPVKYYSGLDTPLG